MTKTTTRRLSLRSRLLAGLIAVTGAFIVVMGVVSTVVYQRLATEQFDDNIVLTASNLEQIVNPPSGYLSAGMPVSSGQVMLLTSPSPVGAALRDYLADLMTLGRLRTYLATTGGQPFDLALPGNGPVLRAIAVRRSVALREAAKLGIPSGESAFVVARPASAVGSQVRGVIFAEVATGAILLALLGLGGRWLIGRGLAPLDRMASTADMITSRGDLTARMPDPGDHAEAGRLAAAINTMLDRIQQAFWARTESEHKVRQFAADASHELRTPLTTIRGYAELYRQGALGPDGLPNAMRRIEQEADRMSSLVAELLELARLDRNSSLDLTETDLSELVRDAVADAQAVEPSRPVEASAPRSLVVVADEPRIRQVLANLLSNVREHTAPDTPVAVRLSEAGQGALLEVTDAGQGMDREAAARAFDRFYRGGHNGNDGHGSGLGLSIVQAIAAAHGGHAMLRSSAGIGTSVQVWIPFHPRPSDSGPAARAAAESLGVEQGLQLPCVHGRPRGSRGHRGGRPIWAGCRVRQIRGGPVRLLPLDVARARRVRRRAGDVRRGSRPVRQPAGRRQAAPVALHGCPGGVLPPAARERNRVRRGRNRLRGRGRGSGPGGPGRQRCRARPAPGADPRGPGGAEAP
jgi:two-component system OmpR family sensor kinase